MVFTKKELVAFMKQNKVSNFENAQDMAKELLGEMCNIILAGEMTHHLEYYLVIHETSLEQRV